eukprot:5846265-Prymnesium_polylepis.1
MDKAKEYLLSRAACAPEHEHHTPTIMSQHCHNIVTILSQPCHNIDAILSQGRPARSPVQQPQGG